MAVQRHEDVSINGSYPDCPRCGGDCSDARWVSFGPDHEHATCPHCGQNVRAGNVFNDFGAQVAWEPDSPRFPGFD